MTWAHAGFLAILGPLVLIAARKLKPALDEDRSPPRGWYTYLLLLILGWMSIGAALWLSYHLLTGQ